MSIIGYRRSRSRVSCPVEMSDVGWYVGVSFTVLEAHDRESFDVSWTEREIERERMLM